MLGPAWPRRRSPWPRHRYIPSTPTRPPWARCGAPVKVGPSNPSRSSTAPSPARPNTNSPVVAAVRLGNGRGRRAGCVGTAPLRRSGELPVARRKVRGGTGRMELDFVGTMAGELVTYDGALLRAQLFDPQGGLADLPGGNHRGRGSRQGNRGRQGGRYRGRLARRALHRVRRRGAHWRSTMAPGAAGDAGPCGWHSEVADRGAGPGTGCAGTGRRRFIAGHLCLRHTVARLGVSL